MDIKFKIFTGDHKKVEQDFNEFLRTERGTYTTIVMSGTKEELVLGVTYVEEDTSVKKFF